MYEDNNARSAVITNVVDCDTFEADVKLGYGVTVNLRFRILEINTPEVFLIYDQLLKINFTSC